MKNTITPFLALITMLFACSTDNNSDIDTPKEPDTPSTPTTSNSVTYPIVETGVTDSYNNSGIITLPNIGDNFYGQDSNYNGNAPSYTNNGDGTITDNVTGLIWEESMGEMMSYDNAFIKAKNSNLAGHNDWRVPTVKELYSLILFTGQCSGEKSIIKFIDTTYFDQPIGDTTLGIREIDAQTWSATKYVGLTMGGDETVFGVNFIDGRIKGYPIYNKASKEDTEKYVRLVRGNTQYGINNFIDNEDETVSDLATGLMWQKSDSEVGLNWNQALEYAEASTLAGYSDWRLPNVKELQSIVDYTRSPQTTNSPAIDPIFSTTEIEDPEGNLGQYPYFWSSTVHLDGNIPGDDASYIAFGEGMGDNDTGVVMDVHGAGCQRSDPKSVVGENQYPQYLGPQGDVRFVFNFVRMVRDI